MATNAHSPRIRRTRSALIAAGLDLLTHRPIDAIAIDELVARAGVAKGSFFNHFADKHAFAEAVAAEVRAEVEAEVSRFNDGVADPLVRLAGGIAVAAAFSLRDPRRARVLLRHQNVTAQADNPLNRGLRADLDAACAAGLLRAEAASMGLPYWLGLCQVMMVLVLEAQPTSAVAAERLAEMLAMGLAGLGAAPVQAEAARATVLLRWER